MDKYDIDVLVHQLELKHKKIIKKMNTVNCQEMSILIYKYGILSVSKRHFIYKFINKKQIGQYNLLNKDSLIHVPNKDIDAILRKLHLTRQVQQSHSFYCEDCDTWLFDESQRDHVIDLHLPLELN